MPNQYLQHQTPDLAVILAAKPFFKIGEVAKLLGVKPHVLFVSPLFLPEEEPYGGHSKAKMLPQLMF